MFFAIFMAFPVRASKGPNSHGMAVFGKNRRVKAEKKFQLFPINRTFPAIDFQEIPAPFAWQKHPKAICELLLSMLTQCASLLDATKPRQHPCCRTYGARGINGIAPLNIYCINLNIRGRPYCFVFPTFMHRLNLVYENHRHLVRIGPCSSRRRFWAVCILSPPCAHPQKWPPCAAGRW